MSDAAALAIKLGLGGEYPRSWDEYVGQEQAKRQLQIFALSAKERGKPMGHVLLRSGQPGIGKTTLALLSAATMDTSVHIVTGKITFKQARLLLTCCEDGDILFIDEIHSMVRGGAGQSEWMLPFLETGALVGPFGPEEVPAITVIGATTDDGRLPDTFLSRFTPIDLVPYTDDEAARIAAVMGGRMLHGFPAPGEDLCRGIARAANNNPRMIRTILANIRDLAVVEGVDGGFNFSEALTFLGLSEDGLDRKAQRYLGTLFKMFSGTAGEKAIRDTMQEPGGLASTERLLQNKGLLTLTAAGRTLTQEGIRRAKNLVSA